MNGLDRLKFIISTFLLMVLMVLSCTGCGTKDNVTGNSIPVLDTTDITEQIMATPTITPEQIPSQLITLNEDASLIKENDTTSDNSSPVTNRVTLLAVGDNLVHSQVIDSGKKADGSYNYDHLFSTLKEDITAADIAIINQETILGGSDFEYTGYPVFNSPTEMGDAIVAAGFDVVLHATNHAMDKGSRAIHGTLDYWRGHPNITVLGLNESAKNQEEVTILEKNGIKIAMLNYTYGLNGYTLPADMPYLVNLLDKAKLEKDIAKAKELADFVIVFPHWGTEYVYEPDQAQKEWTAFLANQGVDLVIGTHPHVLEPVEWIETESGHRMLVYYSLGNYVSYQREAPRMLGGIATITLYKDLTGIYIEDADIIPIVTHYENRGDYSYSVYKLVDYTEEKALIHGVLELEEQSLFTLESTWDLAEQILGTWLH